MNREIKFRAWDKQYKSMSNVNMILFSANEIDIDGNLGEPKSLDHYELMQYTGLQDKNGKEIYEGDIVNFAVKKKLCPICADKENSVHLEYGISKFCPNCGTPLSDHDFITTSKVVFDKGGFAYYWNNEESYYQAWHTNVCEIYLEWVEIIGNIYQNPELLNKQ